METKRIEVNKDVDTLLVMSDLHSFIEPLKVIDGIIASWPGSVQVVVAGDILDGGVRPAETLEWVRTYAGEFAVLGNHDKGILRVGEGDFRPYSATSAGVYQRLDQRHIEYLQAMPYVLELAWRKKLIRVMHGNRTLSDEGVSFMTKPGEMFSRFADPAVDLTIVGHTHYPFVLEQDGCRMGNCGSTCALLLGLQHPDGSITSWGDEAVFKAPPEIYSTFLAITLEKGEIQVMIKRFDYDRAKAIERLREEKHPHLDKTKRVIETGIVI